MHMWRKLLIIAVLSAGSVVNVIASEVFTIKTVPNVRMEDTRKHVSDPASMLAPSARDSIDAVFARLESSTGIEAAVVMLPSIGDAEPFSFSVELFRHWGIGKKKNNNGLLILYIEDQHNIQFRTGYGLEGTLPDAMCKRIQTTCMIPYFKEGKRDEGMVKGCRVTASVLDGSMKPDDATGESSKGYLLMLLLFAIIFGSPIIKALLTSHGKRLCPKCKKHTLKFVSAREVMNGGKTLFWIKTYKCTHCGHVEERKEPPSNDDGLMDALFIGSMFGSGRGGGFSGGGGFGGGSTGGGGSSSSW